jgi:hypothetical protein
VPFKIERLNAWMDIYRRVAVRWDRTQQAFTAWATLACILIRMNPDIDVPIVDSAVGKALFVSDLGDAQFVHVL